MPTRPGVPFVQIILKAGREGLSEYEVDKLVALFREQNALYDRTRELVDPALMETAAALYPAGVVLVGATSGASYADIAMKVADRDHAAAPPAEQLHNLKQGTPLLTKICHDLRLSSFDPSLEYDHVPWNLKEFGSLTASLERERLQLLDVLLESEEGTSREQGSQGTSAGRQQRRRTSGVGEQISFHARVLAVVGEFVSRHNRPPKNSEIITMLGVPKASFYR
jgi:hypothetical protein